MTNPIRYRYLSLEDGSAAQSFPLLDVDFDIFLRENEIEANIVSWPPKRFADRDNRLNLLRRMYQGDFKSFLNERDRQHANLPVNYLRRFSTIYSEQLLLSSPEGPIPTETLVDVATDGIVGMTRDGGALIWGGEGPDGPWLDTIDPRWWYPYEDGGGVIVETRISLLADGVIPDEAVVTEIKPTGETIQTVRGYRRGELLEPKDEPVELGISSVFESRTAPVLGRWGTSAYLDLAPPVVEIARTYGRISRAVRINGSPTLIYQANREDTKDRLGIDDGTSEEQDDAIIRGLEEEYGQDVVTQQIDAVKAEFLTIGSDAFEGMRNQIEDSKRFINHLSGLPQLVDTDDQPSGESLKRQMLPFYAKSMVVQNELRLTIEQALAYALNDANVTIEWPHVFDTMEDQPSADGESRSNIDEESENG